MDEGRSAGAKGTRSLLDAVRLVSTGRDLRGALDRLVVASCDLTGARCGVLGILDDDGVVADLVIHGVDEGVADRIGALPTCEGALGVPVVVEGEVYGNICLTEKAGGDRFTAEDESQLVLLAEVAGSVIANARAHELVERRRRWLEASIAMSHELTDAVDVAQALGQVATRLRRVADADVVLVVEHLDDPVLVAADSGDDDVAVADLTALLGVVEPVLGQDAVALRHEGSLLHVVPLPSRLVPGHSLVVRFVGAPVGLGPDADLLAAFADQAALGLDRTQGLAERQAHMLVADRDRIARDLHDTVIQRLFATALQLQGLRRSVDSEQVRERLDDTVNELSTTIREIRSTIFELRHDAGASFKAEIRGLARDYVPVLGFAPFVRIRGALDGRVAPTVADHLIATMREALSNVARHSDADACVVEVEVDRDALVLRVADNGRGIHATVTESGLRNMRGRALELGGTFRIQPDEPQGTVLEWRVPLAA